MSQTQVPDGHGEESFEWEPELWGQVGSECEFFSSC